MTTNRDSSNAEIIALLYDESFDWSSIAEEVASIPELILSEEVIDVIAIRISEGGQAITSIRPIIHGGQLLFKVVLCNRTTPYFMRREDVILLLNEDRAYASDILREDFFIRNYVDDIRGGNYTISKKFAIVTDSPYKYMITLESRDTAEYHHIDELRITEEELKELESAQEYFLSTLGDAIRPNPPFLSVVESTSRFSGAQWYNKIGDMNVTLAGVGGIGSWTGLLLGRLGINYLRLYDYDEVETANMSGQLYRVEDVGNLKTSALSSIIREYTNNGRIVAHGTGLSLSSQIDKILICGFDNMEARKTAFKLWKSMVDLAGRKEECLFIDGRLAAEELQVLAITGNDEYAINEYKNKWLFDDSEAEPVVCSYKQTSFMANMIASVIINIFVNFVANQCNPIHNREVPFFTYYSADTMFFKTEM